MTLAAGAMLQLDGTSGTTSTTIGALSLDGVAQVKLNQTGTATTTLTIASLPTRTATAPYALQIKGSALDNSSLGGKEQVLVASGAPTVTNGMVSPLHLCQQHQQRRCHRDQQ